MITKFVSVEKTGYNNYICYVDGKKIAEIKYNYSELTQPWEVWVNGEAIHQTNTIVKCENYVQWHHKNGTLPIELELTEEKIEQADEIVVTASRVKKMYRSHLVRGGILSLVFVMLIQSVAAANNCGTNGGRGKGRRDNTCQMI